MGSQLMAEKTKKKLLNRTLWTFTVYSLAVLALSVPAYFVLVDSIWLEELDENNEIIAERTEMELNRLRLTDAELAESVRLWNRIQPGTNLKALPAGTPERPDSTYTVRRKNPYTDDDNDRFRGLSRIVSINGKPFELIVETNVEESEETAAAIALVALFFSLLLVAGFLLLNKRLSERLWRPFRESLAKLKAFDLSGQTPISFPPSDTLEFEELNIAMGNLLEHSISVYKTQKEFTENASHEPQTPLAVIKNKLDNLLQKEPVTDRQYQIIEEINRTLTRAARINRNLLLLAKIENRQFDCGETVPFSLLARQCMGQSDEHAQHKNIAVRCRITPDIHIEGNKTLVEILINNLLINAIRHTEPNGRLELVLTEGKLSVSNSGTHPLNADMLFKRFAKSSSEEAGSGLGLAIVKEVCNRQNWRVEYRFSSGFHCFTVVFSPFGRRV